MQEIAAGVRAVKAGRLLAPEKLAFLVEARFIEPIPGSIANYAVTYEGNKIAQTRLGISPLT